MYTTKFRFLSALALALVLAMPCFSQGWERSFGFANADGLGDVQPTPDGGYLALGSTQDPAGVDRNLFLVKTDADGNQDWSVSIGSNMAWEFGKSICSLPGGGYIIGGTSIFDGIAFGYAVKVDGYGNVLWEQLSTQDSVLCRQLIPLADGGFAMVGSILEPVLATDGLQQQAFLMKLDANGNELWWKKYGGIALDDGYGIVETPDNGLLMAGTTSSQGAGGYDVFLLRTEADGDSLWMKTHGTEGAESGFAIAATSDGNFAVAGQREVLGSGNPQAHLLKVDALGNGIWWRTYNLPGIETLKSVRELAATGEFIMAGDVQADAASERQALLIKANNEGEFAWQKTFGGVLNESANSVRLAPNNGFVFAGFTSSFGAGANDGYLVRTDATGISLSGLIHGNVHSNLNSTCLPDNFGQNIPNYLVEIAGAKTYFATTDASGNYQVPVESGNYNVRLLNPSPIWETCEDSVDIAVVGAFDSVLVNFSIYSSVTCPAMEVDLSTLGLRRCFQNTYTVNYRNLGSAVADPALVEVSFDPALVLDSASIQWVSQSGNTYVFDVGTVPPFGSGSFQAWVTVDCNSTVLGQTHCSEAHVSPDSLCFAPDPNWDGASIEVEAACVGDSVIFTVKNVGDGDMAGALDVLIIEEVIMGFQAQFQLDAHTDSIFTMPADGKTLRMEADQSPGHPGLSQPAVSVEGCGGSPFSTGFVVQYPLNDADLYLDMDCRENTGSYDPNDKQGFPTGYGVFHFIEPGTDIEYLVRFQNTGTDTAINVVIRDTLSPFLDPSSIEIGSASHPFRYELYGTGILKFVFEDIMLPDSNVNEPLSHGFVKFRIKQRTGIPLGSFIENSAAIYFDYNAPVITNTTYHTIGENFIEIDTTLSTTTSPDLPAQVRVYPNPFVDKAMFVLENVPVSSHRFRLSDTQGRLVRQASFEGRQYQFQREGLPSGLYFFQIENGDGQVCSGRIFLR